MAHRHCRLSEIEIFFMSIYILWRVMNRDGRMKAEEEKEKQSPEEQQFILIGVTRGEEQAQHRKQLQSQHKLSFFCLSFSFRIHLRGWIFYSHFTLNYSKLTFFSSSFFIFRRCCLKLSDINCHHKSRRGWRTLFKALLQFSLRLPVKSAMSKIAENFSFLVVSYLFHP